MAFLYGSKNTANLSNPAVIGPILIGPPYRLLYGAALPGDGLGRRELVVPEDPTLVGKTFYMQGMVADGADLVMTNRAAVTFQ